MINTDLTQLTAEDLNTIYNTDFTGHLELVRHKHIGLTEGRKSVIYLAIIKDDTCEDGKYALCTLFIYINYACKLAMEFSGLPIETTDNLIQILHTFKNYHKK